MTFKKNPTADREIRQQLASKLKAKAEIALDAAVNAVPVDTGTLLSSLKLSDIMQNTQSISIDYIAGAEDDVNPKSGESSATYVAQVEAKDGTVITPYVESIIQGEF